MSVCGAVAKRHDMHIKITACNDKARTKINWEITHSFVALFGGMAASTVKLSKTCENRGQDFDVAHCTADLTNSSNTEKHTHTQNVSMWLPLFKRICSYYNWQNANYSPFADLFIIVVVISLSHTVTQRRLNVRISYASERKLAWLSRAKLLHS